MNLQTGEVTTLTGDASATGCTYSTDHTQVRLNAPEDLSTDGYYLYTRCGNDVARISLADGAMSKIVTLSGSYNYYGLTYAADGFIYVGMCCSDLMQVDPVNGTTTIIELGGLSSWYTAQGLASDDQYLWVAQRYQVSTGPSYLDRVTLPIGPTPQVQRFTYAADVFGTGQLVSAGNYVYADNFGNTGVERITKFNGALGTMAGGTTGQSDGEWSNAKFSTVTGIAFDGQDLWIADSGNHLFSKAEFVPLQAQEMGNGSSADASAPQAAIGDPVITNPASGAFVWSVTDATLPTAGLLPLAFTRYYSSRSAHVSNRFGLGWSDSFDSTVEIEDTGNALVTLPNGQVVEFQGNGGVFTPDPGVYDSLVLNVNDFIVTEPDGTKLDFEPSMEPGINPGWMWRLRTITDRDGNVTTLTYSAIDDTLLQVSSVGQTMTLSYTDTTVQLNLLPNGVADGRYVLYTLTGSGGQIASVRDLNGNTWPYSYQGSQLKQISNPLGEVMVTNSYGSDGRVATQQDGNLPASSFDYLDCVNCTRITDGRGHVSTYSYSTDGRGLLIGVSDQDLYSTSFSNFDANYNPQTVTDPRTKQWQYLYDPVRGGVTSVTSPASSGNASYVYNSFNEVTQMTDARNNVTRWVYGATGDLTCEILPTATPGSTTCTADTKHTISYTEYSNGQIHTVISPPNNDTDSQGGTTTYAYYADGMVQSVTRPGAGGGTTSVTTYSDISYSSVCQCQMVTMVTPQGNANNCGGPCAAYTWTYKYDAIGHLTSVTDPLGHATSYGFDAAGRMSSRTDARQRATYFFYAPGSPRLSAVWAPYGSGSTAITSYFYDSGGNLQCEILPTASLRGSCTADPSHTVSYTYTNNNRVLSVADPDGNSWSYDYGSWISLGKVIENLPGGGSITRTYDGDNRLTSVDYSDSTPDVSYNYSFWVSQGKVQMTDGITGAVVYTYNPLNQLTQTKRGTGSPFSYAYFPDGSLKSRTYPDTVATPYAYFTDGSLSTVTAGGKTTSFTYDLAAAKVTKTLPNGLVATTTLDTAGRLTSVANKKGTTTYSSFTVTPDEVGNPTTVVAKVKDAGTGSLKTETQAYTYDDGERLIKVCYLTNCSGSGLAGYSWTYDGVGNRIQQDTLGSSPVTTYYKYDGANHLCWAGPVSGSSCTPAPGGDTAYVYNARGDMTTAGSVTYGYDLADRLTDVTNGSTTDHYTYDGAGNRTTDLHNGSATTSYTWDVNASVPLLATDSDSSTRDYVYGNGLISEKSGTAAYYYSFDAFGSIANVTDASAAAKWGYWYDPWGGTRSSSQGTSPPTNFMQFDGEYHDTTGAYNLRARIYQPGLAVFQQADPAVGDHTAYDFTSDRPTVFSDPSGLFSWGKIVDWFNQHLNPAYGYLERCYGSDGSGSLGSWAGRCALGAAGLAVTAVALARPVAALVSSLRAAAVETAADETPQVLANQAAGNAARDEIAARYPGAETEQTFRTVLGARRVDILTQEGMAIESKVGYTSLTRSIALQIAKDQLLLETGQVSGAQWVFGVSQATGLVGPSGPLAAALEKAGISWFVGP